MGAIEIEVGMYQLVAGGHSGTKKEKKHLLLGSSLLTVTVKINCPLGLLEICPGDLESSLLGVSVWIMEV